MGALHSILKGHSDWVRAVAFLLDSQLLTSASDNKIVRLWDANMGVSCSILEGHSNWVRAVAFLLGG